MVVSTFIPPREGLTVESVKEDDRGRTPPHLPRVGQIFASVLMLVTARLKYVADSEWGSRRYLDVSLLDE